ncbi:NAD-dependent epimerase/dehydratase family protein [Pseudoalteromonas arctica]|uniref:NAD-dependent epimerase/dehydratase family protein n=1 Tax=Pseudoalteromonas arctica TaxID=394751 RepID=UPI002495039C|nr:NAD-dependent epimerase/dehydratase family protein [Pseudoalteromonas arctica]
MNILITGSTGFIGKELLKKFDHESITVFSRNVKSDFKTLNYSLEDLLVKKCINQQFDVAIHLAGLAHNNYVLQDLRKINVESTLALAKQLADNGLKRFVFISSIGVNGNKTDKSPFTEFSLPNPHADYAVSKYEAEIELTKLSKKLGFELVIIRPPLVYGSSAPGNFKSLYSLITKGIPLPFGLVNNSRSFISVSNLCDFIALSSMHPSAAGELFLISDDDNISTKTLVKTIWQAKNINSLLIPVPTFIFKALFKVLGRSSMAIQLFDNLEVDNAKAKKLLGWLPKQSMIDVFKK